MIGNPPRSLENLGLEITYFSKGWIISLSVFRKTIVLWIKHYDNFLKYLLSTKPCTFKQIPIVS